MTKKRHRRHSIPFKKMIVEAYFNGAALNALSVEHDVCRHLIRTWIEKYEKGEFDSEAVEAVNADLRIPQKLECAPVGEQFRLLTLTSPEHGFFHSGLG